MLGLRFRVFQLCCNKKKDWQDCLICDNPFEVAFYRVLSIVDPPFDLYSRRGKKRGGDRAFPVWS